MSEVNNITNVGQKSGYSNKAGKSAGTGNTDFSSYLVEKKSLDDIFTQAANKYNVPVNLLKAIGKAESDFDADAVSRCGAQGIMQLMPKTAASLGVKDSFDAEQNIMGGAKYISELLEKYDGDTSLALAAYNAGMNNVKKYGGIPPFKETQDYVVKVTNFMNKDFNTGTVVDARTAAPTTTPVTTPAYSRYYIAAPQVMATTTSNVTQDLDAIFSDQDYMKLLDMLLDDENENDNDKENEKKYWGMK